jgi:hypothetical protein
MPLLIDTLYRTQQQFRQPSPQILDSVRVTNPFQQGFDDQEHPKKDARQFPNDFFEESLGAFWLTLQQVVHATITAELISYIQRDVFTSKVLQSEAWPVTERVCVCYRRKAKLWCAKPLAWQKLHNTPGRAK